MPTVETLAELVGGRVIGERNQSIEDLADLRSAGPNQLSFLANSKYFKEFQSTRAGAVLVAEAIEPSPTTLIVCADPYLAMGQIGMHLHRSPEYGAGIDEGAFVHPTADVHPTASIRVTAVVEAGAKIGSGCRIEPGAYVGRKAVLDNDVLVYPGAKVLDRCIVGARSILHAGCVVGSDGFGYAPDSSGERHKLPQMGIVELGKDVVLGANTTIDRATFGITKIGDGTKLDNLIQIAHNVELGEHVVMASQSGIAGSTKVGSRVVMGAQAGITGHVEIADDVQIAARAGICKNITQKVDLGGFPARPHKQWLREMASQRSIPELRRRIRELEDKLETS